MEKNLKKHYVALLLGWVFMLSFDTITGFADHGAFEVLWFVYFGYVNYLKAKTKAIVLI